MAELGTKSKPFRCSVGVTVDGLGGAGLSAATTFTNPMDNTASTPANPRTVAVVAGSTVIALGGFDATNADNGLSDALAGFNALRGGRDGDACAALAVIDGPATETAADGLATPAPACESMSATAGDAGAVITRVDTDDERLGLDGAGRRSLFGDPAARVMSSAALRPDPADDAARGDSGTLDVRLPLVEARVGPADAAASAVDDESVEPGSAAAMPQPVRTAAPTPKATASPRTRPTDLAAFTGHPRSIPRGAFRPGVHRRRRCDGWRPVRRH